MLITLRVVNYVCARIVAESPHPVEFNDKHDAAREYVNKLTPFEVVELISDMVYEGK